MSSLRGLREAYFVLSMAVVLNVSVSFCYTYETISYSVTEVVIGGVPFTVTVAVVSVDFTVRVLRVISRALHYSR